MNLRYFLLWLPMIGIAFANATIRQLFLVKYFTELQANQLSTVTLTALCALYIGSIYRFLEIQSLSQAMLIGFIWMILTTLFEFSLGLSLKKPMATLLVDYNILQGHIWPIFLVSLCLLPAIFFWLKK